MKAFTPVIPPVRFMMSKITPMQKACIVSALALCAIVLSSASASAQLRQLPQSQQDIVQSFAPIVKQTSPAVVNVYVRRERRASSPFFNDPFFKRFFGRGFGGQRRRNATSLGSGVVVRSDGIVVTNYHVIKGSGENGVQVAFADKRRFNAKVMLKDERTDLAILKIEGKGKEFPVIKFANSDGLQVGDLVLAIGNPFGVGQTVTSGIISALARTRVGISDYQFFIQTDAPINPGNSGGALVDMRGQLVGINTAIYSRSGGSHGIGFAIPANMVNLVVQSALRGGRVKRPWLGAKLQNVNPDIAESLGLDRPQGALITHIYPDSPAKRAGLVSGDVLLKIENDTVEDPRAFNYRLSTRGVGGNVKLEVLRGGKRHSVRLALTEAPEIPKRRLQLLRGNHPFSGAQIGNLSPAVAEELSVQDLSGVIVFKVTRHSSAQDVGLKPGDIIMKVNGQAIRSVNALRDALSDNPGRLWRFSIKRGGRVLSTAVRL